MKILAKGGLLLALSLASAFVYTRAFSRPPTASPLPHKPQEVARPPVQNITAADRAIDRAEKIIQRDPDACEGYNELGAAFMQKARETGDFSFTKRAEAATERSSTLAPDNYGALKLRAKLAAANHRFAEALETAQRALERSPRDLEMRGIVTDANVELGHYPEAMDAAAAMIEIRPYAPSYARVSYLSSLHGDTAGAVAAMRMAEQSAADAESLAWCAVHLGDELMNAGQRAEAEHEYDRALFAFPNYHFALAAKARARVAAGNLDAAVAFYERAQERVPLPDVAIALGNLYVTLGRATEAQKQYALAEFIDRSGNAGAGTYSRQIALSWADRGINLDQALAIAQRERAARSDIYTSDLLAWCFFRKGQLTEAKTAIEEALRLKTRDAQLNYHAGMIYQAFGDPPNAIEHLRLALEINPTFDLLQAQTAKQTLQILTATISAQR